MNEFKQFNAVHPIVFVEHSVTNRLLFVQREYFFYIDTYNFATAS